MRGILNCWMRQAKKVEIKRFKFVIM
jgi:hypothetical protein